MMKKYKLDPQLLKDLWSGEERTVLKTLWMLRSRGNIGYIPELLKLLNTDPAEVIRRDLIQLISDIKSPDAKPFILAGLRDQELSRAREYILTACWQSGLDYSQHADVFVDLFLDGDYSTALEAFTVIEEATVNMNPEQLNEIRDQVRDGLQELTENKKPLAVELVRLLS
jgi:hypothetical protein